MNVSVRFRRTYEQYIATMAATMTAVTIKTGSNHEKEEFWAGATVDGEALSLEISSCIS
jgi:hypothetical protein